MWLKRLSWAGLAALLMMSGSLSGAQGDCETNRLGWSVFPVSSVCVCVFSTIWAIIWQFSFGGWDMVWVGWLCKNGSRHGQPLASARLVCERLSRWPCSCLNRQFRCVDRVWCRSSKGVHVICQSLYTGQLCQEPPLHVRNEHVCCIERARVRAAHLDQA